MTLFRFSTHMGVHVPVEHQITCLILRQPACMAASCEKRWHW